MKKRIIKAGILLAVFLLGVAGFSCLMNQKGTDNKTDMETAVMPVMAMLLGDTEVNRMYGYAQEMETDYLRDTLTPVGTDKTLGVSITPNGQEIDSLVYEIRTFDGDKVVENDKIKTFQEQADGKLTAEFTLKKSILMNQEYALVLTLNTEEGSWNYYTRLIQRAGLNTQKYLDFVSSFYTKTFSKDNEGDLSAYMESDQSAGNNSFYDLNIHADMDMLTWGLLAPQISRPGIPSIKEINENTGSVSITYSITAENENGEVEHYQVEEFYRMRYDQTRIRLLDFKRSAKQVLTTEQTVASGGRLNLGVTDREVQYKVSEDGGIVAFVQQGDLWAYNIETNKLTRIFTFRDTGSNDERNDYDQHDIQIVRIEENGDMDYVVYGYMNRGSHEGMVGTAVYHYDCEQNVSEEKIFLSSGKAFPFLKDQVEVLSYVSKEGKFYMTVENTLYEVNMEEKTYTALQEELSGRSFFVSGSGRYAAWTDSTDRNEVRSIVFLDLEDGSRQEITAEDGSRLRLFGFINDDVIYGIARDSDISAGGGSQFVMEQVRIQNHAGELVKDYQQDGYFVTDVQVQDNLLVLKRVQLQGSSYAAVSDDQIMNNVKGKQEEAISLITQTTVRQANVTALQYSTSTSTQEALVMEGKFMENAQDDTLNMSIEESSTEKYYVYAEGGLEGIYTNGGTAVQTADSKNGVVLTGDQQYLWERSNTKASASISLEDLPDGVKSAPLDAAQLAESVRDTGRAVSLNGCTLEEILYQVSQLRPVIAKGQDGKAKLIIGFDTYNLTVYDPATGETSYQGRQDSEKEFTDNGSVYICYIENIQEQQ